MRCRRREMVIQYHVSSKENLHLSLRLQNHSNKKPYILICILSSSIYSSRGNFRHRHVFLPPFLRLIQPYDSVERLIIGGCEVVQTGLTAVPKDSETFHIPCGKEGVSQFKAVRLTPSYIVILQIVDVLVHWSVSAGFLAWSFAVWVRCRCSGPPCVRPAFLLPRYRIQSTTSVRETYHTQVFSCCAQDDRA